MEIPEPLEIDWILSWPPTGCMVPHPGRARPGLIEAPFQAKFPTDKYEHPGRARPGLIEALVVRFSS